MSNQKVFERVVRDQGVIGAVVSLAIAAGVALIGAVFDDPDLEA